MIKKRFIILQSNCLRNVPDVPVFLKTVEFTKKKNRNSYKQTETKLKIKQILTIKLK